MATGILVVDKGELLHYHAVNAACCSYCLYIASWAAVHVIS